MAAYNDRCLNSFKSWKPSSGEAKHFSVKFQKLYEKKFLTQFRALTQFKLIRVTM